MFSLRKDIMTDEIKIKQAYQRVQDAVSHRRLVELPDRIDELVLTLETQSPA